METISYGFGTMLAGSSFEAARDKVTAALAAEGFGVLTEIDVKATLKTKLDVDVQPYVILGACNPELAHRALEIEPQIGLLLPCNVVVKEEAEGAAVLIADPRTMFNAVHNPALEPVVRTADERLHRVLDAVNSSAGD